MRKNVLIIVGVVVALAIGGFIATKNNNVLASSRFYDISSSYWAYEDIISLTNKGVLNGYPDGSFRPDNNLTRAEMAKIVVLAFDLNSHKQFTGETWYENWLKKYDDALWWKEYSIRIRDYFANAGHQILPITAEEIATRRDVTHTLINALNPNYQRDWTIIGYDVPNNINNPANSPLIPMFKDMQYWLEEIAGYDKDGIFMGDGYYDTPEHIYVASKIGLIFGYPDGTFKPQGNITRAEFCAMVNRALSLYDNLPII